MGTLDACVYMCAAYVYAHKKRQEDMAVVTVPILYHFYFTFIFVFYCYFLFFVVVFYYSSNRSLLDVFRQKMSYNFTAGWEKKSNFLGKRIHSSVLEPLLYFFHAIVSLRSNFSC